MAGMFYHHNKLPCVSNCKKGMGLLGGTLLTSGPYNVGARNCNMILTTYHLLLLNPRIDRSRALLGLPRRQGFYLHSD